LVLRDLLSLGASVTVVATGDNARYAAGSGAADVVDCIDRLRPVDGIVVVTPTSTHADVIEALLPRRVPIFCEKPLCDNAERAVRLAEMGRDQVFVMDKWRYHRGVLELAAMARSRKFGPVVGLRTTRIGYSHSYSDTDCIWTLLPHDLSIALEILGCVPVPRGAVADVAGARVMGLVAFFPTDNGPWHVAEVSARSPAQQRAVTLFCRDATLLLPDSYADHIVVAVNPPPDGTKCEPRTSALPIIEEMPLLAELKVFVEYLIGGPPPKSSVREAAQVVKAVAEARRLAGI
jgi:predicted dehydrogenase